jgi:prepilin-type N-terminal cleavage/methylation domain-containing protein
MSTVRRPPPACRAFSLLELLIVLAVLAGVAALSWPAVGGLLAKSELRSAARQVRAVLTKARLEAMESSQVVRFRYQPGTGRFEIARAGSSVAAQPPADGLPRTTRLGDDAPGESLFASEVRFEGRGLTRDLDKSAEPAEGSAAEWSPPIWFFPNGRTSPAHILLGGRRNFRVQVSLRGVTGAVAIGPLERVDVEAEP